MSLAISVVRIEKLPPDDCGLNDSKDCWSLELDPAGHPHMHSDFADRQPVRPNCLFRIIPLIPLVSLTRSTLGQPGGFL